MPHPNRRSVNAALFRAFLRRLETTPTLSAPSGYPREELTSLLRSASVELAVERVNEEWERVAQRVARLPDRLRQAPDGSFFVVRADGKFSTLSALEYQDLRKQHERLGRGLPELRGMFA